MNDLTDVAMICADTTRSRAYLQNLARAGLRPAQILVMERAGSDLPGQSLRAIADAPDHADRDPLWRQGHFDPNTALAEDIAALGVPTRTLASTDINDADTVAAIAELDARTLIYSGFGGQILRAPVLATGKQFLHVHGGYLPDFRGSTTNYYSMIADDTLGASAIFLTAQIDAGPILLRRRFPAPPDRTRIDHLHDAAARAICLCDVLRDFADSGVWPSGTPAGEQMPESYPEAYYVIHPVLKHLAIYHTARSEVE